MIVWSWEVQSSLAEAIRLGRICGEDRQEIYEIASPEVERRV